MNVRAVLIVIFVAVLGTFAWSTPAHAESEKVKTNQETKLYRRPGEQSPVILTIKAGQMVTVVARDGRWLRVRVSGRTGWVPRSKVDLPEGEEDFVRNTRRQPFVGGRGTKRGFGGEAGPDDRIGADATEPAEPAGGEKGAKPPPASEKPTPEKAGSEKAGSEKAGSEKAGAEKAGAEKAGAEKPAPSGGDEDEEDGGKDSVRPIAHVSKPTPIYEKDEQSGDPVFTADPKMALYVGRTKGNWTRVSSEEGDAGWVLTSKLTMDPQAAAADGGPRRRLIHLHGGLGLSVVSQSVATTGGANQPPDNYAATSPALGVSLGGTLLYPVGQRYWIGGELGYDFAYAVPGVSYNNQSTSVMVHDLDVRGIAGREFGANNKAVTVRLGYHFDSYQVSNTYDFTKNTAKVPNQIIQGPTIGLGLAIPRFTDKLAMTLAVDTMLFGSSVEQTKGLEDGTGPSATAFFVATGFVYRWKPKMSLELMLDLDYTAVSFTGMPPANPPGRGHTGTATSSGSDLSGGLTFGIVYAL